MIYIKCMVGDSVSFFFNVISQFFKCWPLRKQCWERKSTMDLVCSFIFLLGIPRIESLTTLAWEISQGWACMEQPWGMREHLPQRAGLLLLTIKAVNLPCSGYPSCITTLHMCGLPGKSTFFAPRGFRGCIQPVETWCSRYCFSCE